MRRTHARAVAGLTAVAAGGFAAYALRPSDTVTATLAAHNPAVEVRTQIIRRTIHVIRHESAGHFPHPRGAVATGSPGSGPRGSARTGASGSHASGSSAAVFFRRGEHAHERLARLRQLRQRQQLGRRLDPGNDAYKRLASLQRLAGSGRVGAG